jgi:hypothetical protein
VNLVRAIRSGGVWSSALVPARRAAWRGSRGANTGSLRRATERRRLGHARPPNTWPQIQSLIHHQIFINRAANHY